MKELRVEQIPVSFGTRFPPNLKSKLDILFKILTSRFPVPPDSYNHTTLTIREVGYLYQRECTSKISGFVTIL